MQEAIFILDGSRRILFVNTIAESIFGKLATGSDFVRTIRHPQCMEMIEQVLQGQEITSDAITIENPVKTTFNVLVTRLGGNGGEGIRIMVSMMDISERRQIEQMRSDFVANVSHELRSPLTALTGFIETLQGTAKQDAPARARFLKLMEREASRMARLVSELLSLSKFEAPNRVFPRERCDIVKIVNRVRTTLSEMAASEGKTVGIEFEEPELFVSGDEDALVQVFQNLIENAIKYSAANSTVTVTISEVSNIAGMNAPAAAIVVQDQGEGIPQEHIARLTERFYRVDSDRSREKGGTGLGLAIVKHIINQHRGRLKIESEMGVGSTFSVFLPKSV
jgi:two-component system phosphate regulon sensor histidine kinase PhoR